MNSNKSNQGLICNLEDTGCSPEVIKLFLEFNSQGRVEDMLLLLSRQRRLILNAIHREQKRIDCLDYLVYKIKKSTCKDN